MGEKQCGPKMILPAGADRLRVWIFAVIGGIVFAAFDRFGYMLKSYGSIWAISENFWHRNIWMRILIRIPASVAAVLLFLLLMDMLGAAYRRQKKSFRGSGRYWFPAIWLLYFVSFLPAFLGGFPGLFAADAPNQVGWTFSGWLTAHHPLLHTGILCGIFSAARGLGWSDNAAAAIYTLLQMLAAGGYGGFSDCHALPRYDGHLHYQGYLVCGAACPGFDADISYVPCSGRIFSGL